LRGPEFTGHIFNEKVPTGEGKIYDAYVEQKKKGIAPGRKIDNRDSYGRR